MLAAWARTDAKAPSMATTKPWVMARFKGLSPKKTLFSLPLFGENGAEPARMFKDSNNYSDSPNGGPFSSYGVYCPVNPLILFFS